MSLLADVCLPPDFFEEAKRLVASAIEVTNSEEDALQLRGILGEVLRAKGDLYDAVHVLREVLAEQGWGQNRMVGGMLQHPSCGGGDGVP